MAVNVRRRRLLESVLGVGLLGLVAVLLNVVAGQHALRFDLTADARYTLAPETRALLGELKSPLEIKLFLPSTAPAPWSDAARGLADLVEAGRAHAGGRLRVITYDTAEAEAATQAASHGLLPADFGPRGGQAYFGAVLLYEDEKVLLPPTPVVADLEFELARALRDVLRPEVRKPLILFSQGHGEPDVVASPMAARLRASGELENFALDADLLPGKADALVILGPTRPFDARSRYVIDQFLMEGGTVLAFIDYRPRSSMFPDLLVAVESGLEPLFAHLGVPVETDRTVLDRARAQPAPLSQGADGRPVVARHPMHVGTTALSPTHPVTRGLRRLVLPFAAPIRPRVPVEVLVTSEPGSVARQDVKAFNPEIYANPVEEPGVETPGPFTLGVVLAGTFASSFTEPPARPEPALGAPPPPPDAPILRQGRAPGRLLLVTSGRRLMAAGEDAALLLANAVDWAVTDSDLAGLRARAATDPPLRPTTPSERTWFRVGTVMGPPGALLLFGLLWAMRRRR